MVASARRKLLGRARKAVFHCTARCVRRAFLCGLDPTSGEDYSHRRDWIVNRHDRLLHKSGLNLRLAPSPAPVCVPRIPGRPKPDILKPILKCRLGRDLTGPALAITDGHHKRTGAQLLGHQLISYKRLSGQQYDSGPAPKSIQGTSIAWPAATRRRLENPIAARIRFSTVWLESSSIRPVRLLSGHPPDACPAGVAHRER